MTGERPGAGRLTLRGFRRVGKQGANALESARRKHLSRYTPAPGAHPRLRFLVIKYICGCPTHRGVRWVGS